MNSTIFVGLDVHKKTVSVAVAESGRGGEVRHLGTFENRVDVLRKTIERLARGERRLNFCYEAGPCGYGLYCQRRSKNASASRSENTSIMVASRPSHWGLFVRG